MTHKTLHTAQNSHTRTRRYAAAFAIGSIVAAAAFVIVQSRTNADAPTPTTATDVELRPTASPDGDAHEVRAELRWRAGEHLSWTIHMDASSTTRLPSFIGQTSDHLPAFDTSFALRAQLHAQVIQTSRTGDAQLRVWIDTVDEAHLRLGDEHDPGTQLIAAALHDTFIDLRVDTCGRIHAVGHVDPDIIGAQILQSIVETGWPVVCGDRANDGSSLAHGINPQGDITDTLRAASVESDPSLTAIRAEQRVYTSLRLAPHLISTEPISFQRVATLRDQRVTEHTVDEHLVISDQGLTILDASTHLTLRDVRRRDASVFAHADITWHAPGERTHAADTDQQLMEQRAGDLSGEVMMETLAAWGVTGTVPEHNEFLWRAPARMALEPELLTAVSELSTQPGVSPSGRALMLDLIAQTPSPYAGEALLDALSHPAMRAERTWPMLLQRAGFVEAPPHTLVAFVHMIAASNSDDNETIAARYALGSLVAALDRDNTSELADQTHAHLVQWVTTARTADQRIHGIRALANAERPGDIGHLLTAARDADPRVRAAAASSMESFTQNIATAGLVALAADTDLRVQREAIAALRGHTLDARALGDIAHVAATGGVFPENAMSLLDLAKYYVERRPQEVIRLAHGIAATVDDPHVRAASMELRRRAGD